MKIVNLRKILVVLVAGIVLGVIIDWVRFGRLKKNETKLTVIPTVTITIPTITAAMIPTKIPVKQLTFDEMNNSFGPCVRVPVLMFHHIQEMKDAKEKHQTSLTVIPEDFRKDMEYLKTNNYTSISLADLAAFFDQGLALPKKSVAITLDDAYEDNYSIMWPILKEYGFKATIFTPTGLVQNPDYLSWDQIKEMSNSGLVYFGNHTWSHHGSTGSPEVLEKEISLADTQLNEHGENQAKIFAYPYGNPSKSAESVLQKSGYKMAFTTVSGSTMCKGKRYELPRIRVGNASLKAYGL